MEKSKPRVLLIGAGGYGNLYLNSLLSGGFKAELVGICDISPHLQEQYPIITEKNIPVYAHPLEFYAAHSADLAIISTPIHTHKAFSFVCMQNGSNVLCEKPLCLTLEDAQAMIDMSQNTGCFLSLGYQLNYRKDVLALKQDILSGRFGLPKRMAIMQAYRRGRSYYQRNNWAGKITVNGRDVFDSPFANGSAHNFQMMTFLLGKDMYSCCDVVKLDAELYRGNPAVENYDIACMRFETDCGAEIYYYTAHPIERDIEPYGVFEFEKGTITFDSWQPSYKAVLSNGEMVDYSHIDPGHDLQKLVDALEAVEKGGRPVCGAEADIAHIHAVQMAQQIPILSVRDELKSVIEEAGDEFVCVKGLETIFAESLKHFALPKEIGKRLT